MGIPDVSGTISTLHATIKLACLNAYTKVKPPDSAPLLAPILPSPTTSIRSSSSLDSPVAFKHYQTSLVISSSSTTISAGRFGYNSGCPTNAASQMLESVSPKGEVTSSGAKPDILWRMTWLLHGGFRCLSIYKIFYLFQSLISLSASKDVRMRFQCDIEEWYSSVPHFPILHFSICLGVLILKFYCWLLDFIGSIPYHGKIKRFLASWEFTAASWTFPIIYSS